MSHFRSSRLWLALTTSQKQQMDLVDGAQKQQKAQGRRSRKPAKQQSNASPPPLTIGNGLLPPELFLQIFSSLNFLDLLCCRHVSRLWSTSLPSDFHKSCAKYTPQRSLTSPDTPPHPAVPNLHIRMYFSVQTTRHFQHDACRIKCSSFGCTDPRVLLEGGRRTGLMIHPLLAEFDVTMVFEHRRPASQLVMPLFPQLSRTPVFPCAQAALAPENWRRMQVCVPAVSKVTVVCEFENEEVRMGRTVRREVEKRREVSHGNVGVGRVVGEVEEMVALVLKEWFY